MVPSWLLLQCRTPDLSPTQSSEHAGAADAQDKAARITQTKDTAPTRAADESDACSSTKDTFTKEKKETMTRIGDVDMDAD